MFFFSFTFTVVLNGQSSEHSSLYAYRNDQTVYYLKLEAKQSNYLVSTISDKNNEDTGFICNKLLESCPSKDLKSGNDNENSNSGQDKSNDISNKYFENDGQNGMQSLTTANQSTGQNITGAMEKIQQPILNHTNATGTHDNLRVFEELSQGIKILYPSGWQSKQEQDPRFSTTLFLSPKENSTDQVRESLLLRINKIPTNLSLDDYTKNVIESQKNKTNFRIVESNSKILSGNPAHRIVGITNKQGQNIHVIDTWTIKDGIVYRIVFSSEEAKFAIYKPVAQKMIESFTIIR
jgi:hypothetical protein